MAKLFTDLLQRFTPKQLARELNIAESTARRLSVTPLARFPRVTNKARNLTRAVKAETLRNAGVPSKDITRARNFSFTRVDQLSQRARQFAQATAQRIINERAEIRGLSESQFRRRFPQLVPEAGDITENMRTSRRTIQDFERDSI